MGLLIFDSATASLRPSFRRNNFSRSLLVTLGMIISFFTIEAIQAVGREKILAIGSRRDSKERARELRNSNNNVFRTSIDDYESEYDDGPFHRAPAAPTTSTPEACHVLSESAPGVYGSTQGTVVEVSFQYDVVTSKALQDSIYTDVIPNIEMKLTNVLVDALMTPCNERAKKAMLNGVSCYPADTSSGSPFETEDGHLCSPMNGTVSVYFTSGDVSDQEFMIESSIKGIFEDGLLDSAHTGILETHYRPKDYEFSSASADNNIIDVSEDNDEQCHSYLEETEPGVYGDKKGTLVTASYQYDVVTNPVTKPTYKKIMESIEMKLTYLIAKDLGPSCGNDQDPVEEIALGGVSCYPADELESEPFNTSDGHLCTPMIGFVSLYLLDKSARDEEMLVQKSIENIMDTDKLTSVHPDIFSVEYVGGVPNSYSYHNTGIKVSDVTVSNKWWKQLSFAAIAIAAAGTVLGLISIGFLVKKQRKKSSQLLNDDSVDGINTKFILSMSAFTPRTFSASDATVKISNKSLSLSNVMPSDLDESTIGSTDEAFNEMYSFDERE